MKAPKRVETEDIEDLTNKLLKYVENNKGSEEININSNELLPNLTTLYSAIRTVQKIPSFLKNAPQVAVYRKDAEKTLQDFISVMVLRKDYTLNTNNFVSPIKYNEIKSLYYVCFEALKVRYAEESEDDEYLAATHHIEEYEIKEDDSE